MAFGGIFIIFGFILFVLLLAAGIVLFVVFYKQELKKDDKADRNIHNNTQPTRCKYCNAVISEGSRFCIACGKARDGEPDRK